MNEQKKTLAFDLETARLASEVEEEYADALGGESAWTRPNLFWFGCGVVVDVGTNVAYRYRDAAPMIEHLGEGDVCVSYNGESFDLGALSAYADVSSIREKHVDINVLVMAALDALPVETGDGRIRQGGLDGLARANGLPGKEGEATSAPALLREGKVEEVLSYCEHDVRLVASLYRLARETGKLAVNAYVKKDCEKVELGRLEVAIEVPGTRFGAVGSYTKEVYGYPTTIELWRTRDLAEDLGERVVPPEGTVCGAVIVDPPIKAHIEMAGDDVYGYLPDDELLVAIADYAFADGTPAPGRPDAFWLRDYPSDSPGGLVAKL